MNFQRTLKLGAHNIKVVEVPNSGMRRASIFGEWDPGANTISIAAEIAPTRKVEVLLHELFHSFVSGHESVNEELCAIQAGEGFAALVRYNPDLIEDMLNLFKEETNV